MSLYVPGELLRQRLVAASTVMLYSSRNNPGASDLVRELQEAFPVIGATEDPEADAVQPTHFVLYLNFDTFVGDEGERLVREVRAAMAAGLSIVMPHEHDPSKGGCAFERFFTTTPHDVVASGLYKSLALPCYPGVQDRQCSMACIAKNRLGFEGQERSIKSAATAFTETSVGAASTAHSTASATSSAFTKCARRMSCTAIKPAVPRGLRAIGRINLRRVATALPVRSPPFAQPVNPVGAHEADACASLASASCGDTLRDSLRSTTRLNV
jgi:hypothetical protein